MFIAQAFKVKHEFWRYIVGSVVIIIASIIGQLPLGFAVFIEAMNGGMDMTKIDEKTMYSQMYRK